MNYSFSSRFTGIRAPAVGEALEKAGLRFFQAQRSGLIVFERGGSFFISFPPLNLYSLVTPEFPPEEK